MSNILDTFARVTTRCPCPICGKHGCCLVSRDDPKDPSKVICARVESEVRLGEAGWLHRLRDDAPKSRAPFQITLKIRRDNEIDFASLMTHNADGGDQQLAVEVEHK